MRLAVRNQHSPTLSTFNKPWQWRFDSNGKNRGVSSLLPLSSANVDAGFVVDDTLVLQLWLRPRGVAVVIEARHLCMEMRGIRRRGMVETRAVRGDGGGGGG